MKKSVIVSLTLFVCSCGITTKTKGNATPSKELNYADTLWIGENRQFQSLDAYFSSEIAKDSVHIILEEGTYYTKEGIWFNKNHLVIEGKGRVNLYCTDLYTNVMWVTGSNVVVKNLHMKHFAPGSMEGQNCSGRVIGFDGAKHCVIQNCDLNGCGLAGLHDNLGNEDILIKDCYIHNNSVGAYTNIDGDIWQEAIDDHPVFRFENNRIENNGPNRKAEGNSPEDYLFQCPPDIREELLADLTHQIDNWKSVPKELVATYLGTEIGDYFHVLFQDESGKEYDFGSGNNNFGEFELFLDGMDYEANSSLKGKQFRIFWDWEVAEFPCCSGEYEFVQAYQPSVIRLELLESINEIYYEEISREMLPLYGLCSPDALEIIDYYSLMNAIPSDEEEHLMLVELLKSKGFEVTNYGRGNWEFGPRIVSYTLQTDQCECQVDKLYYSTEQENTYRVTERIKCN